MVNNLALQDISIDFAPHQVIMALYQNELRLENVLPSLSYLPDFLNISLCAHSYIYLTINTDILKLVSDCCACVESDIGATGSNSDRCVCVHFRTNSLVRYEITSSLSAIRQVARQTWVLQPWLEASPYKRNSKTVIKAMGNRSSIFPNKSWQFPDNKEKESVEKATLSFPRSRGSSPILKKRNLWIRQ